MITINLACLIVITQIRIVWRHERSMLKLTYTPTYLPIAAVLDVKVEFISACVRARTRISAKEAHALR